MSTAYLMAFLAPDRTGHPTLRGVAIFSSDCVTQAGPGTFAVIHKVTAPTYHEARQQLVKWVDATHPWLSASVRNR